MNINAHLLPDERVVQICKPNPEWYAKKLIPQRVVGCIVLGPVIAWQLYEALSTFSIVNAAFCIFTTVLLIGIFAAYGEAKKKALEIEYIVTNHRVIIKQRETVLTSHRRTSRRDIPIWDIWPEIITGAGGSSYIKLGPKGIRLEGLDNAEDVVQMLRMLPGAGDGRMRMGRSNTPSEGQFPLRLGETVLWFGKPEIRSYILSETLLSTFYASILFFFIAVCYAGNTALFTPSLILFGNISVFGIPAVICLSLARASLLRYMITNERVLVWRPRLGRRLMERELSETFNMKVCRRCYRTATIVFDKCEETFHAHNGAISLWTEVTFHAVADYEKILQIVKTARQAALIYS